MRSSAKTPGSILDRLATAEEQIQKQTRKRPTAATKRKPIADRIAASLDAIRDSAGDPAAQDLREELFAEIRQLMPTAIGQAKKGKPALLRILCRYTR